MLGVLTTIIEKSMWQVKVEDESHEVKKNVASTEVIRKACKRMFRILSLSISKGYPW